MNTFAVIMLLGWPLVIVGLFMTLKPGRAPIAAYIIGWLFLPLVTLNVVGLPPYGKFTATSLALIFLIPLFDLNRLFKFRPHWLDLPMLVWLLISIASSLSNDLGLWNGISGLSTALLTFGIPYFVGRLYLRSERDWLFLTRILVVGALIYVPLCIWESRMSPQLHAYLYGFSGRTNFQFRSSFGMFGWQPNVFMNSAFEVTALMAIATLITYWAWRTHRLRHIYGLNVLWLTAMFIVITILCKKWSGIGLMLMGLTTLGLIRHIRWSIVAYSFVLIPTLYMILFVTDVWRGEGAHKIVAIVSEKRAQSLEFRLANDRALADRAMIRPLLGWGGWGRNRIYDERGKDISVTDSAWMIYLGTRGLIGLISITLVSTLPFVIFVRRFPPRLWLHPSIAIYIPFVIVLGLHLFDNLFNGFENAMYPIIAGGLVTLLRGHRRIEGTPVTKQHLSAGASRAAQQKAPIIAPRG